MSVHFDKLDPLFETVGLISASYNTDMIRSETVKVLNDLGVDGEKFYNAHMNVFTEYVKEFKKHYQPGLSDELFFSGIDNGMLILLLSLLLENRSLLQTIDEIEDSQVNCEIIAHISALYDSKPPQDCTGLDSVMSFLEKCSFTDCEKWKLLQILRSPKNRFQELLASINVNIPAFEIAQSKVSVLLEELIEQYSKVLKAGKIELFGKLKKSLSKTSDVYPSLAFPISQMLFSNSCYYGLLSTPLVRQEGPDQNLIRLKALSDASRLEILRLIKQKPMYNLEIAEQLNLTAATMSHHMGVLLACGFVGVTKQEAKVYYHLETKVLRRFIESLDQTLV